MNRFTPKNAGAGHHRDAPRSANLNQTDTVRLSSDSSNSQARRQLPIDTEAGTDRVRKQAWSLDELAAPDHREFVHNAYQAIVGRSPTAAEQEELLKALMRGDPKTWLLGTLRYGTEGRACRVSVSGLRLRYVAQWLFRVPVIGPLFSLLNAVVRLPHSLRYFRATAQSNAERRAQFREADLSRFAQLEMRHHHLVDEVRDFRAAAQADAEHHAQLHKANLSLIAQGENRYDQLASEMGGLKRDYESAMALGQDARSRLDAIFPPKLDDTLEVPGSPLADIAKERAGIPLETSISSLTPDARYALFETIFYESPAVAAKQRIYIPYIECDLTRKFPFLDLGCGRGEFLRILRGEGIEAIGVDINPVGLTRLRADGFNVVEQDLLSFLKADCRTFSGASILQVAEHLTYDQIERMLALVAARLAPGAVLIVETPNPLSPFALGVFHTDPTHINPLPPEGLRFSVEAAGFQHTRTLFQARIPKDQFAGPDPRAYYADYAIIAQKLAS